MRSVPIFFAMLLPMLGDSCASVSMPDFAQVFTDAVTLLSPPSAVLADAAPAAAPRAAIASGPAPDHTLVLAGALAPPAVLPKASPSAVPRAAIARVRAPNHTPMPAGAMPLPLPPAPPAALTTPPPAAAPDTAPAVTPPAAPAALTTPASPAAVADAAPAAAAPPTISIEAAVADLRSAMVREVPELIAVRPQDEPDWNRRIAGQLAAAGRTIDQPQLLVTVDRNPAVQQLRIVLARPDAPWLLIGATRVSTGEPGLTGHYKTPVGVFEHTKRIIDYRAEGTFSRRHHLRGLGVKGMRVWDFGWHTTEDWRERNAWTRIRLEIHATDPDTLEREIGQPVSKGCVHVSAALNRFLDRRGIIDAAYEQAAQTDGRYRELLLTGRTPTPLAGTTLVVFDSSQPDAADLSWPMAGLI